MRSVVQRVTEASVSVDGVVTGQIDAGLLVFLGIESDDSMQDAEWLAQKLPQIRIFEDEEGRMNRSLADTGGQILLISQFTLFGTLKKGTRPSFNRAAPPSVAIPLYESFHRELERVLDKPVPRGVFGAYMKINADNDGPVTLILDTKNKAF